MLSSPPSLKTGCYAPYSGNYAFSRSPAQHWLIASFSYPPWEHPSLITWLWNAPSLNHNHMDHNPQAVSITPTSPAFYLRPPGLSAHLFNYPLNDNPVPSMCQSLEIQPRIADTTLHRAHNPPLLPFSLPAPSYLLFPTFPAQPSP